MRAVRLFLLLLLMLLLFVNVGWEKAKQRGVIAVEKYKQKLKTWNEINKAAALM